MIILKLSLTATAEYAGYKLSTFLLLRRDMSHRLICRMKHDHRIHVNGVAVRTNYILSEGDFIELYVDIDREKVGILPENLDLDVIYEDDSIFAINKRPSMLVHPVAKHQSGTIANGIAYLLVKNGFPPVVRPLSRLDRDTSGILLFAKNAYIQESLIRQMKQDGFGKHYFAIVHNKVMPKQGSILHPIARKPGSIVHREVNDAGQKAITHYRTITSNEKATFLDVSIETGRTHQIRVHLTHLGFPIIGDDLYDPLSIDNYGITRQALHSYSISFVHPYTKKAMELYAPLPKDMKDLLSLLALQSEFI